MALHNVHGNTFGSTSKNFGGGKNIWHEVKGCYPVGGKVDLTSYAVGDVIPAGSKVYLNQSTHVATIVLASDSANLAKVNGLLYHDIVVDDAAKSSTGAATAAVVYEGEIYVDRCADAIDATVLAKLPQIVAIHEQ